MVKFKSSTNNVMYTIMFCFFNINMFLDWVNFHSVFPTDFITDCVTVPLTIQK